MYRVIMRYLLGLRVALTRQRLISLTKMNVRFFNSPGQQNKNNLGLFTSGIFLTGITSYAYLKKKEFSPLTAECSTIKINSERMAAIKSLEVIADVAQEIAPAVVSITSGPPGTGFMRKLQQSNGSGFIADSEGHIITNAHVVGKNSRVHVRTADKKNYDAQVLAVHFSYDLALIKINAPKSVTEKLPTLPFAPIKDPNKIPVRTGEFVLAAGCPLELDNSITLGVVSAVERDLGHQLGLKYIQTDAIITFGNSGGPLVNLYGQVVGVNTMIAGTGLGFSIPVNNIIEFYEKAQNAIANQSRDRSSSPTGISSPEGKGIRVFTDSGQSKNFKRYLGLVMSSIWFGSSPIVRVQSVMKDSPAHRAGIKSGDIILEVNDKPMAGSHEIQELINSSDRLTILVSRGREQIYFRDIAPEQIE